ncbi:MAG: C25 family cysteine peptidase [Planctomycetota bacterium]
MEWGDISLAGESLNYAVSFHSEKLALHPQAEKGCLPLLEDCGMLDLPGAPSLPVYAVKIPLQDGYQVTGIKTRNGSLCEVEPFFDIAPAPELCLWEPGARKPEWKRDPALYESRAFFPGRLYDLDQGQGMDGTFAYLKIYPLQYRPSEGKLVLAEDLQVELICSPKPELRSHSRGGVDFLEPSLILCPEALVPQADRLAALHLAWGRPTKVLSLDYVKNLYAPAEDPADAGYKNPDLSDWDKITGYDYDLALRIVSMMRDAVNHPNLESVTLLGDAALVPPSYYFWFDYGDPVGSWMPSDIYFESPDYDLSPDYLLGRISVSDAAEAELYLDKVEGWVAATSPSWSHKVTAGGGIPFGTNIYMGELIQSHYFNQGVYEGLEPTVQYFSEDTFTKTEGRKVLTNGEQGFYLHIGHGSGNGLFYDDGGISATELSGYTPRSDLPIIISVSCMNGAFDSDLINMGFSRSFAEAVLISPAAGICYIGGARSNSGDTQYHIENSKVIMDDQTYMIAMLGYAMQGYDSQTERISELIQAGRIRYLAEKGVQGHNKYTYLAFCLHGDADLPILARPAGTPYTEPVCHLITPHQIQNNMAVISLSRMETLNAHFETTSPEVKVKIIHPCELDTACVEMHPSTGNVSVRPMKGSHWSVLRAAGMDGRESWSFLLSNLGSLATDGDRLDWRKEKIRATAHDPAYDMTESSYDLVCLYHKRQDGFDYLGFDVPYTMSKPANYCLAIDHLINKGYTGTPGVNRDAASNWVTFTSQHAPDFEIVITRKANGKVSGKIFKWSQSQWVTFGFLDDVGVGVTLAYDHQHHFIELAIPENFFGSPLPWYATLYSAATNGSPAQDSTPSDPATFTEPHYGSLYANTLTEFVRIPR